MIAHDRNADYNTVTRTADNTIADPSPPAYRRPEPSGPQHSTVACPLCTAQVVLLDCGGRVEGRCPECTVLARFDGVRVAAAGWMGGGDMVKAGRALRNRKSRLERKPPVVKRKTRPTGSPAHGTKAGHKAHRRRGEQPCDECRDAYNAWQQRNRARRREVAA